MSRYSDIHELENGTYETWAFNAFAAKFLGFDYDQISRWGDEDNAKPRVVNEFGEMAKVAGNYDVRTVSALERECPRYANVFNLVL
ncbi:hypothetical protein HN592_03635 [Candidatus Woesearchaeota archaeon]|jgi:hypothetical protein|nr:hypothetical protein [Candidatus Woesearchaeota archaeon]MBT4368304.1 hypothetical protein [Candidatus Woesearchaeota archaeon]MBT4712793.1 hypothetical protein [Candidatus Woesearchaeota archaeon]MBT6639705.1 hypothetical protein [Candidatus Woesearchaeota archaeon]MBT7133877.1 hypothetical protein [Candidatus Woesearchaeota archaeon]